MQNHQPTGRGSGLTVRNLRPTAGVVGSGGGGSESGGLAGLSGSPGLLDTPTRNNGTLKDDLLFYCYYYLNFPSSFFPISMIGLSLSCSSLH